ncbi:sigma-54 dependent transcriptional regulator [Rugamonas sp.]|uniref:sigma-54-dependent transcriptional regulator n=1 Tax=Rugamonas sp. TaxID=1926287 RepID=UPI0025EC14C7|nr:sigma-54 dependent transcriptional regulator [Rugamonas sp.]
MDLCSSHILVLDDDADVLIAARVFLRRKYQRVQTVSTPAALRTVLERDVPDVVLLDLNFTHGRTDGAEGLSVLGLLLALPTPPAVIALTAYADVALAVTALKRGAADFITKPWNNAHLEGAIDTALGQRAAQHVPAMPSLISDSPAMRDIKHLIARVGPTDANVMILGENGVGKELVARAVHDASRRRDGPFLAVDMGTLPMATFESELFGHVAGAYTDARGERAGRFQAARGGSLFLDEIGNMPLAAQAKLLAALERRQVTPMGSDHAEEVDVRIISATNLNEAQLYDPAVFRADLMFRMNTIVIRVPPLRERPEDIAPLWRHYLAHYERQYRREPHRPSADAAERLRRFAWPGNVRSLRHACERAVIVGQRAEYTWDDFGLDGAPSAPAATAGAGAASAGPAPTMPAAASLELQALEREAIVTALAMAGGNISRAARLLGVSRAALYRKLERHAL